MASSFDFDIAVIGGGSAGMASALSAAEGGAKVALIERDNRLGGILNQCIHNGFGLKYFKEELTGPEYATRFENMVKLNQNIQVMLNSAVLEIKQGFTLKVLNPHGLKYLKVKSIIFATGCRERPAGAINLTGTRPAGVMTAGAAQNLINIYGKKIGNKVVIVGSGDIGLIMARRLTYEGATVLGVYEILKYPSGLKRNIAQCLNDNNIPLHLGKTVVEVVGQNRVSGVYVASVKDDFTFDLDNKEFIECDAVVLSVGLTPENSLMSSIGVNISQITGGAVVDEHLQTNVKGVFSCGNGLHVHDIVDNVSKEAECAGQNAALFVKNKLPKISGVTVKTGFGVRYVMPTTIYPADDGFVNVSFRVSSIFENVEIVASALGEVISKRKARILLPAEMESIVIPKNKINSEIEIFIKE